MRLQRDNLDIADITLGVANIGLLVIGIIAAGIGLQVVGILLIWSRPWIATTLPALIF